MPSDLPPLEGYQAVERLAHGPVTSVYRALHASTGRKVVLKTLSPGILHDSAFAQNLQREASILALLSHPNIVALYDFKISDSRPWLVREWVDGWTLAELLPRLGSASPLLTVALATQLASALTHVHALGLVHRSLRPDCILVGSNGVLKLIGFAHASGERIARIPELVEAETDLTAPSHLSPEQMLGEPADARSDLFSLGVVLHQLLTGSLPQTDEAGLQVKPRFARAGLHGTSSANQLEHLIAHCLAEQPNDRVESAETLLAALLQQLSALHADGAQHATLLELQRAGVIPAGARTLPVATRHSNTPPRSHFAIRRSGLLLAAIAGGVLLLGTAVHLARKRGLLPAEAVPSATIDAQHLAEIRVVVEPWARVYVNGSYVDVTPFARVITVPAGTHQFRFEHPNAPPEMRQVSVVSGESILLDVQMRISRAAREQGPSSAPSTSPSSEPGP